MDPIEALAENEEWMRKFCKDCKVGNHCLAEYNPFYEAGCIRKSVIKDIEAAADNFMELCKEAVA